MSSAKGPARDHSRAPRPLGASRPRRGTTASGRFPDFPDQRAGRRLLGCL